jgi:hypothetical protein
MAGKGTKRKKKIIRRKEGKRRKESDRGRKER